MLSYLIFKYLQVAGVTSNLRNMTLQWTSRCDLEMTLDDLLINFLGLTLKWPWMTSIILGVPCFTYVDLWPRWRSSSSSVIWLSSTAMEDSLSYVTPIDLWPLIILNLHQRFFWTSWIVIERCLLYVISVDLLPLWRSSSSLSCISDSSYQVW